MSHATCNPVTCTASALRQAAVTPACAPVEFYYGYWFSHWRA